MCFHSFFPLLYKIRIIAITSDITEHARNNVLMNRRIFLKTIKGIVHPKMKILPFKGHSTHLY